MAKIALIAASEIASGTGREVVAEGRIFAVYRQDEEFHVLDGICPHAGGPLGKGTLQSGIVTCPWHGWQFDVETGQHCLSSEICAARWPATVENGMICITLENAADS